MWCAADNHNYVYHICAKGLLDSNFNKAVIDKMSNFQKKYPKFHIFKKIIIFKV